MKKFTRREFLNSAVEGGVVLASLPLLTSVIGCGARKASMMGDHDGRAMAGQLFMDGVVDEATMKRAVEVALARGGDFADVYLQRSTEHNLRLEDDRINRAAVGVSMGLGVRVVKGEQTGYAYTENLTPEAIMSAAGTASLIASGAGGVGGGALQGLRPVEVKGRYPVERYLTEVDVRDKMGIVEKANGVARSEDPAVERVQVLLQDVLDEVVIVTSDGRLVQEVRPKAGLLVMVVVNRNGRRERNLYHMGGRRGAEFFTDQIVERTAQEAVRRSLVLFDAVTPPAGTMPVVMAPGSSGILLHEAVGHGLEADFNRKNLSVYANRIGQEVASDLCTVVDTGLVEGDQGMLLVDDEGTPCEHTVLIEKGVLKSYMQDKLSAAHMGMPLTGNGRRESYKHVVQPRMRVTYMEPGEHSKDEIIASVKRGIYAIAFSNGQVNIGPGDFSFYVNYGFLIEDGKIGPPIKDVNLIGNGPEVLSRVVMVGDDLHIEQGGFARCGKGGQGVPVGFGQPHVKVSAIAVGGVDAGQGNG